MAWRALCRDRGFTLAAILLLGVTIGGTAAVFTVTDALLLRRLPAPRPEELARVVEPIAGRPPLGRFTWAEYEGWRARTRSFAAVFAYTELDVDLEQDGAARTVRAGIESPEYFTVLGVRPALGRLPARDDEVLLSDDFRRGTLGADGAIAGRVLRIHGHPFTVAGVLPRGFHGVAVESGPLIYVPFGGARYLFDRGDGRTCCEWEIGGRLRAGTTPAAASEETAETMARVEALEGISGKPAIRVVTLEWGVSALRERFGKGVLALFAGAGLLLLLACANIAGMMVARAAAREREMAVRAALGATRARLVRLWLQESSLLALCGGAVGVAVAAFALPILAERMPPLRDLAAVRITVALDLGLNWRAMAVVFGLSAVSALMAGVAPAWHAGRAGLVESLKQGPSDPRRVRLRAALTVAQVALCTVVLANAALLVETLRGLRAAPAGIDRARLATFTVEAPGAGDLAMRLERGARALPGVESAAVAARSLMRGSGWKVAAGLPGSRNRRELNASSNTVSPEYFATMGMRIVAGRSLAAGDGVREGQPRKVVVNQAFARRFFPGTYPVGGKFGIGFDRVVTPDFEIVGVVTDARYRSLREPFQPTMYTCWCGAAQDAGAFSLEVRSAAPSAAIPEVETLLRSLAPGVAFREVRTMEQDVEDSLWAERTLAAAGSAFAGAAAVIAALGLYGLLAYTLAQRRREMGIRIALGAGRGRIARTVVGRVLVLVACGAAAGTGIALWTERWLRDVLWQGERGDVSAHAAAWAVVVAAALAAAAVPAWRAARTDAVEALREGG
ncbi:MAG: ABC transporter permease [Acidobacteriota bacterium]|nr:ABC transporter permease [Acidobacteriota bacterium]